MQVLNAKRAAITFQLDNGEPMTIQPHKYSIPFVGTAGMMRKILTLGTPDEIGIVINSSYEYDRLNEVSAAQAYVYRDINEAIAKLIDGKEPEPEDPKKLGDNVEILKLKESISSKNAEIEQLKKDNEILRDELANAPLERYKEELDNRNKEYLELKSKYDELSNSSKSSLEDLAEYKNRLEALKTEHQGVLKTNDELSKSLEAYKESEGRLGELEAENEKLKTENTKLTEDSNTLKSEGAKLLDNYNKMKSALTELCQLSGYTMIDGKWVKSE